MDIHFELQPIQNQVSIAVKELENCNTLTARFGLSLSSAQIQTLVENRFEILRNTGRVEFGGGILPKLIYAFCDSPYLSQDDYEYTLSELQELFYYFKSESMEALSDDELIESMVHYYNNEAHGSLEYLTATTLETLCRGIRTGNSDEWEPREDDEDGIGE